MEQKVWLDIDLHLFDGGSAAGDGAGGITGGSTTQTGPADAGQDKTTGDGGREGAPAAEGREGRRTGPGSLQDRADAQRKEERRKRYQELIDGEFKDLYTEDTQRIIDKRFKATKELERKVGKNQSVIDTLMKRYGISDGDADKLLKAIDEDGAYWAQAAQEAGMSVEQYRRLRRFQRENKDLLASRRQRQLREKVDRQLQKWDREGAELRSLYPGFDLSIEARQPRFLALLKAGVPIRHAYEVIHMEDIKAEIARASAKNAEKQVVAGIRAKGTRPQENGTSGQSGFTVKEDVSKLTKKDRAEIARRVARGEKIMF